MIVLLLLILAVLFLWWGWAADSCPVCGRKNKQPHE